MYAKIIKYISLALLLISAVIGFLGFFIGFETNNAAVVDTLLYWAYVMVLIGVCSIVVIGIIIGALNNPKSLIKLGLSILGIAVIIAIAYVLAPGSPALGLVSNQPDAATLKFTDTILNITYFTCAISVIAIIIGAIVNAIRSK